MWTNPIVVIKLVLKVSSEKRKSKQLFPTPAMHPNTRILFRNREEGRKIKSLKNGKINYFFSPKKIIQTGRNEEWLECMWCRCSLRTKAKSDSFFFQQGSSKQKRITERRKVTEKRIGSYSLTTGNANANCLFFSTMIYSNGEKEWKMWRHDLRENANSVFIWEGRVSSKKNKREDQKFLFLSTENEIRTNSYRKK